MLVDKAVASISQSFQRFKVELTLLGHVVVDGRGFRVGEWSASYVSVDGTIALTVKGPKQLASVALAGCNPVYVHGLFYPYSCRLVNVTLSQPEGLLTPGIKLVAEGYGVPSVSDLVGGVTGLATVPLLIDQLPIPLASSEAIVLAREGGSLELRLDLRALLVYPPHLARAVASALKSYGCSVAGEARSPLLLTVGPLVAQALSELGLGEAAQHIVAGRPATLMARLAELCMDVLEGRFRPSSPEEAYLAASLCSIAPMDVFGMVFSIDLAEYGYLVAKIAASARGLEDELRVLLAGWRPATAVLEYKPDPLSLQVVYYLYPILKPLGKSEVVPPLPLPFREPPDPYLPSPAPVGLRPAGVGLAEPTEEIPRPSSKRARVVSEPASIEGQRVEINATIDAIVPGTVELVEYGGRPPARLREPSIWEELQQLISEMNTSLRLLAPRYTAHERELSLLPVGAALPSAAEALGAIGVALTLSTARWWLSSLLRLLRGSVRVLGAGGDAIACYEGLMEVLSGLGLGRRRSEGPYEHLERLPARLRKLLAEYVDAYSEAVYGGRFRTVSRCGRTLALVLLAGPVYSVAFRARRYVRS
jgi:hypothetical protein